MVQEFETALEQALAVAYTNLDTLPEAENRFLHRILYRINRLNFVWYKDLNEYINERSYYLQGIRDRIETPWQAWELAQIDVEQLEKADIKQALIERGNADLEPPFSANKRYLREQMTIEGYRHLIAIAYYPFYAVQRESSAKSAFSKLQENADQIKNISFSRTFKT